jgi:hypothetical protein
MRGLINASRNLLSEHVDDIVKDAGGDGDVFVDPGGVLDCWDLDW